ncbi:hypothetical protein PSm6_58280 [Pseudomonas solani]|uniref:Uncharacterized protein n=1 Tax=Pseudomonas solani TaxID=2731552 RepID=A0ABM7LIH9_9PSED|nr:hypothetical protein PSm6_58280 [Pseudomonas solani]
MAEAAMTLRKVAGSTDEVVWEIAWMVMVAPSPLVVTDASGLGLGVPLPATYRACPRPCPRMRPVTSRQRHWRAPAWFLPRRYDWGDGGHFRTCSAGSHARKCRRWQAQAPPRKQETPQAVSLKGRW